MRFFIRSLIVILLVVAMIFAWFSYRFFYLPVTTTPKLFIVKPDETIDQLSLRLSQQHLIPDRFYFLGMAKLYKVSRLKSGEYQLDAHSTANQLLQKLQKGQILYRKITFVEGWTFKQMLTAIRHNPYLAHTLPDTLGDSIPQKMAFEGLFYPDTYLFSLGTKDTKILQMSRSLMQKKFRAAWLKRAPNLPYQAPYQALIIASMVEKETANFQERPIIAGIILKRLQLGMRLQIDATVIYGLGQDHPKNLTRVELLQDTPYNTYTRKGLPPTPIAMPSYSSIQAALHPQNTPYLYYVAKGDGTHRFSENLQAHHAATQKYLAAVESHKAVAIPKMCFSAALLQNSWKSGITP
ncbi:MAG: endolytic transglycosylase MltG [Gammaproteobacteria bacterium]